jgi:hypothetical protein
VDEMGKELLGLHLGSNETTHTNNIGAALISITLFLLGYQRENKLGEQLRQYYMLLQQYFLMQLN